MRISDWSSDVCSSDLALAEVRAEAATHARAVSADKQRAEAAKKEQEDWRARAADAARRQGDMAKRIAEAEAEAERLADAPLSLAAQLDGLEARSEEHTSELQSLMRISSAVYCLKKKKKTN